MQTFLEETPPDKRRAVVDRLLESPAYPTHFAGILRAAIVPEVSADPQLQFQGAAGFEQWLRRRIAEDAGYDRIARELLTAPAGSPGPGFYFVAKGGKPENVAAGASRVFLASASSVPVSQSPIREMEAGAVLGSSPPSLPESIAPQTGRLATTLGSRS